MINMKPEYVKEFLSWSIPCLTHPEIYDELKQDYIRKVWPKIKDEAYKNLNDGVFSEGVFKAWYKAYPIWKKLLETSSSPMKDYMFSSHNEAVIQIYQYNKGILPCLALVGRVVNTIDDNLVADILGKNKELINTCKARRGDYVGVHIGEAVEVLKEEDFNKYNELIKKYYEYV